MSDDAVAVRRDDVPDPVVQHRRVGQHARVAEVLGQLVADLLQLHADAASVIPRLQHDGDVTRAGRRRTRVDGGADGGEGEHGARAGDELPDDVVVVDEEALTEGLETEHVVLAVAAAVARERRASEHPVHGLDVGRPHRAQRRAQPRSEDVFGRK